MKSTTRYSRGFTVAFLFGATMLLADRGLAQGLGVCSDSTNRKAWIYLHSYAAYASSTDPVIVADRAAKGIPTLTYAQVSLVTDTAACRTASTAFDAQLLTKRPSVPVIVVQLGTKRMVIKDTGLRGRWLNMLFTQDFATLLRKIGY